MNIYIKYALTAFLVVIISETAKRSDRFGGVSRCITYHYATYTNMVIYRETANANDW